MGVSGAGKKIEDIENFVNDGVYLELAIVRDFYNKVCTHLELDQREVRIWDYIIGEKVHLLDVCDRNLEDYKFAMNHRSELEIKPRYPLFGGWKSTFVIGYGLPLQDFLFESADGRRYLNFSFGCPLLDTIVDKLTVKMKKVAFLYVGGCGGTHSIS